MLFKSRDLSENPAIRVRIDSIYGVLKAEGTLRILPSVSLRTATARPAGKGWDISLPISILTLSRRRLSLFPKEVSEVVESRWAIIYLRVESVVPRVERCRPHIS